MKALEANPKITKKFLARGKRRLFISICLTLLLFVFLAVSVHAQDSETILFKLESNGGVYNGPPNKTVFTLSKATHITKIFTYHWNNGSGAAPGTIGLKNTSTGEVLGPWDVVATYHMFDTSPGAAWPETGDGPPYIHWTVQPHVNIPAGTYEVVDSSPSTWSYNSETQNMGMAWVYGSTETILFKLESNGGVHNGPPIKTVFTLSKATHITKIFTYHWNNGSGAAPGTIGLKNTSTGEVLGPWDVVATYHMFDTSPGAAWPETGDGPPYIHWTVQPHVNIPAGTYEVVDSSPSTWSYNFETQNMGMAWVYGYETNTAPAPLDTPANFGYTMSGNLLTLYWSAVNNAVGYKIGVGTGAGNYNLGLIDMGNITSIGPLDVTGVTGTFYLAAKAYNGSHESGYSNEIVITLAESFPAPRNLRSTLSGNMLTINWDAVTGAEGYILGLGMTTPGSYDWVFDLGNIIEIGPIDMSGSPGTYYLGVKAYNSSLESGYSNGIVVTLGSSGSTTIIGNQGGTVSYDDIALIVPAGAFTGSSAIGISPASAAEGPFSSNAAGKAYTLTGVPLGCSKPLSIKVKHDGTISGKGYIAVGASTFSISAAKEQMGYQLLEATESGGYLIAELPVSLEKISASLKQQHIESTRKFASGNSEDTADISVIPINPMHILHETSKDNNFMIIRWDNYSTPCNLGDAFESALSKFTGLDSFGGMGFDISRRTRWPIEVYINQQQDEGEFRFSLFGTEYNYITLREQDVRSLSCDILKQTVAHELFHLIKDLYDPRPLAMKLLFGNPWLWLDEASSTWSEQILQSAPSSYISANIALSLPSGLNFVPSSCGDNSTMQQVGYGMAPVIKYFVNKFGPESLKLIFEGVSTTPVTESCINAADYLLTPMRASGASESSLYLEYLPQFMTGALYERGWVGMNKLGITTKELPLNAVSFSFTEKSVYTELSSKVYYLPLQYAFTTNDKINIAVSDVNNDSRVLVFEQNKDILSLLGAPSGSMTISNAADLKKKGNNLVVVVANTRGKSSLNLSYNITLTVSSGPAITPPLSPSEGPVGTAVVINGVAFGNTQTGTVTFNGTAATVTSWSDTQIKTTVPAGATTGNVVVTVNDVESNGVPFTINGDCINDPSTGLCWDTKDSESLSTNRMDWAAAGAYCAGKGTRLPTIEELVLFATEGEVQYSGRPGLIYETGTDLRPRLTARGYEYAGVVSSYWSSTTLADSTASAWFVNFYYGSVYPDDKLYGHSVRCVRGGQ